MMFWQVLRLIGAAVFVFSTCIFGATALKCESGGSCYLEYTLVVMISIKFNTKNCSDSCVYFKCFVGDYKIMEGAGCFEDFVNICKYVDPQLLKEIKSNHHNYTVNSRSLVMASCNRRDGCAKEMFDKMIAKKFLENARLLCKYAYPNMKTDECVKKEFDKKIRAGGHRLLKGNFLFEPKFGSYYDNGTCEYDNTPKQKLSQVKCETKGWCKSGYAFDYDLLKDEVDLEERQQRPLLCDDCARDAHMNETYCEKCLFETKTCDACSKFLCTLDGKEIISGHGCFEDFERMCNVVMNETIKNELSEKRKNYFYADQNIFMVTCSDSDDCQFDAFRKYFDVNFGEKFKPPLLKRIHFGDCDYKPLVIPPTTTTMTMTESTSTTKTSSSSSTTTTAAVSAAAESVSFESTSQQKEEEKDISNSSVSIYASFYLMCLILMTLFVYL